MRLLLLLTSVFLIQACSSSKKCRSTTANFMNSKAEINLNLSLSEKQLIEFVDQLAPDTLFADDDLGGQDVAVLVKKNGQPALKLIDRTAEITMPLTIDAKRDMGFLKASAQGSMFLTVKSTVDIQKDWTWSTQTEIVGIEWVEEPKLKVMGLQLSVGSMIEKYLKSSEKEITDQIDQAVLNNQLLKKAITNAQPNFERSYAVDPERQYFVQVIPKSAGMSPFDEKSNRLFTSINLEGHAHLINDSSALVTSIDTPSFFWIKPTEPKHNVLAHLAFTEADLQKIIQENVLGEDFEYKGKKSVIDKFDLRLTDGQIEADVYLKGGIQGSASFVGRPNWNPSSNELELCEADVDLKIKKGISKFLLWIGKSTVEKRIIKAIEDNVNDEIRGRIKEVNNYLDDFKVGKRMSIKADIYDYALEPIEVANKQLQVGVLLNIRGKLFMDQLEMKVE